MPDTLQSSAALSTLGKGVIAGKAVACLQCRAKHLKCDATFPACTRCQKTSSVCSYLKSRRGYNGKKRSRLDVDDDEVDLVYGVESDSPGSESQPGNVIESHGASGRPINAEPELTSIQSTNKASERWQMTSTGPFGGYDRDDADQYRLIHHYYRLIHPSHPFLIPRSLFERDTSVLPDHLKSAMCFLASHIADGNVAYGELGRAEQVLQAMHRPHGYSVQTLLVLTISSFARFETAKGLMFLQKAREFATKIGMGSETFESGSGSVWQESWRRTWWELQTLSVLAMLFHNDPSCSLPALNSGRLLPASCDDYEVSRVGITGTLDDFRARTYFTTDQHWSSWAYKIEATAILADVISFSREAHGRYRETKIDTIHTRISGFLLTLPSLQPDEFGDDHPLNEVLCCAQMIVHLARICLHAPYANLGPRHRFQTSCNGLEIGGAGQSDRSHARLAFMSANAITKSLSMRRNLTTLTPCFSCAIAFGASVQLAVFTLAPHAQSADLAKENVIYSLKSLQTIGKWWPIALTLQNQLAAFARDLFSHSNPREWRSLDDDDGDYRSGGSFSPPRLESESWLDDFVAAMPPSETGSGLTSDLPFLELFAHSTA